MIVKPKNKVDLARIFKILSDPTRYSIFDLLMNGRHCHCEVAEMLGLSLSLVSHHLRVLQENDLINATRDKNDARWVHYDINQDTLSAFRTGVLAFTDANRIQPRQSICAPRYQEERVES